MRRIGRSHLSHKTAESLQRKQRDADKQHARGTLDVATTWKSARGTKTLQEVLGVLKRMVGPCEPCMYCHDSHGADIEHFWPKREYPERMFVWLNLLLCCSECGRFKGNQFPLDEADAPLLIDPTSDDPWRHLDYDPDTGNITARFDATTNAYAPKGEETVRVLQLDRREALAIRYQKTFERLRKLVQDFIDSPPPVAPTIDDLRAGDDHGLIDWCLNGAGASLVPFEAFRERYPTCR